MRFWIGFACGYVISASQRARLHDWCMAKLRAFEDRERHDESIRHNGRAFWSGGR